VTTAAVGLFVLVYALLRREELRLRRELDEAAAALSELDAAAR
jgi:hypothetical protein